PVFENKVYLKYRGPYHVHLNVWAGVIGNQLVGPHICQGTLNSGVYLDSLQHTLPTLLDGLDMDHNQRDNIVFQQDGAPPHFRSASVNGQLPDMDRSRWNCSLAGQIS
ncbi:hypothetical protein J6590_075449, partial [Homalodisca vitripennis]